MIKDYGSENTIMRINYETGESFNTLPQVIAAGGKIPEGWRNEKGQLVKRKERKPKRKSNTWDTMITERREWKDGEEERLIQLQAEGMSMKAIGELYGIPKATIWRKITKYKKLKKS